MYNMDKLYEAVAEKGHVCVGLDTAADYIPPAGRRASAAEDVLAFNKAIVDATIDTAACFKVQIAYYEEMGRAGLECYAGTLKYIRERGAPVIADIKRGDIADTAERYARAHFEGDFEADFVTLSPYLGMDSIEPWLGWATKKGKGAFVLMRTSNRGRRDFECLEINEGGSPPLAPNAGAFSATPPPRRLYHAVGNKLSELAASTPGRYGYGAFGAVAGCTEQKETSELREMFPALFFLIPGYGAQGGGAEDAALLLRGGNGGVVNASRSILKAWSAAASSAGIGPEETSLDFAAEAARMVAAEMRDAIRAAAKK